jgi:Family of unknown function (DUF6524)
LAGQRARQRYFGTYAFLIRFCGALFVVFSTYNPSGVSYYHWVQARWSADWPLQLPLVPFYAVGYALLLRSTFRALRPLGIALVVALIGALVWLLLDMGLIRLATGGDAAVILLCVLGALLAVGASWMWIWTRVTGQVNYDDLTN